MTSQNISQKEWMLATMDVGYSRFNAYLDTLTEQQLTVPTDAAGWTAKDHIMHLAVWAGSMVAVINRQPRWEAMGVSAEVWRTIVNDYDQINAVIQQHHRDKTLATVRAEFTRAHRSLVDRIEPLTAADLVLPYSYYQPWAADENYALHLYILGNTADHYDEHQTYIAAIVKATFGG